MEYLSISKDKDPFEIQELKEFQLMKTQDSKNGWELSSAYVWQGNYRN